MKERKEASNLSRSRRPSGRIEIDSESPDIATRFEIERILKLPSKARIPILNFRQTGGLSRWTIDEKTFTACENS
jgi:hypothetical protein